MPSESSRIEELKRRIPSDQVGVRGEHWAGLFMLTHTAEILIENLDGSWELVTCTTLDEIRRMWLSIELNTECEPGPDDMVLEHRLGNWVVFHWDDCDSPKLTSYHVLEEAVQAAFRWRHSHGLDDDTRFWMKEGCVFSLLDLG